MCQEKRSITTNQVKSKAGKQALKEVFFKKGICLSHSINKNKTKK